MPSFKYRFNHLGTDFRDRIYVKILEACSLEQVAIGDFSRPGVPNLQKTWGLTTSKDCALKLNLSFKRIARSDL
ncbi:hypothetical protein DPMN_146907 [Dreissena polymorpha]|uniref:Uncharacterized protein n=1 Tax=Dreissena polymorpha TaxID=45954 RepID=A0A9D4J2G7_DREPO|nr:hypothetical protein DPMN_146907 [Dreissena polymorpha]